MTEHAPHYTLRQERSPTQESTSDEKHADEAGLKHIDAFEDPNLDKGHLVFEDESPYPEVRSAVANTDDPEMPVSTLRAWIIGIAWAIVVPGANQFFFFRFPSITIGGIVAQLLSFPVGRAAAAWLPKWKLFGISLNPGPFTVKEHATVGYQSAYATDIVAVQKVYYNQNYNFSYQWLVVMSTQLIGFSIGGIARRFLVAPPSMIWPTNLVNCALFNTLHSTQYAGIGTRGGMSRERFFVYAFIGSFTWYFFPGYIFQALSYFSWVTWIRPDDPTIAALFGYIHGMGMSVVTFDWRWAEANVFAGFVFFFCTISSRTSYDNQMKPYNVTRILKPDSTIDIEAYHAYSPLFISFVLSFASITATLVHAFLYFRKQIWVQSRRALSEQPDIHARLMSRYPQVPEWWYLIIFLSMFTFGVISIEVWPSEMPVWAFVLALIIAFVYIIPIGMIQAITNQQIGLNVITELVIGYALPGRPVAMMLFKTWGYITMAQALAFTSDFKLGHYMKLPPRLMFSSQVIATIIAGTTQLGVQAWMFTNIDGMCTTDQRDGFICPNTEVFGTASVIGPGLQFSKGQTYYPLVFFFLVGAVAPVFPWALSKKYPNSFLRYINPVIFNGTGLIPPATAINYVPWAAVGFIFQYLIRRRHFSWWTKYNYVLSAALDSGVAVSIILIFFALQFPKNGAIGATTLSTWWGNTVECPSSTYIPPMTYHIVPKVPFAGADFKGTPVRTLAPGAKFG
ncbi:small oligopeptide transporter [Lyophyllum atratum]|nr:small oligopeptide transporter [Lyophyllum atratum]